MFNYDLLGYGMMALSTPSAVRRQHHVGVGPRPVQGEEQDYTKNRLSDRYSGGISFCGLFDR